MRSSISFNEIINSICHVFILLLKNRFVPRPCNDIWEVVEEDYEVPSLTDNPTMAQLKSHTLKKSRKSKAKATLFVAISEEIFTRIMHQNSTFEVWNFLITEYEGDDKVKGMQVLNLIRAFEMQ